MDNNDNLQKFTEKIKDVGNTGNVSFRLRSIHIDVENIYEDIKRNKSSFIYKMLFFILFFTGIIVFIIHIFKYGFSFGAVFLILLVFYFFYYTYIIKKSIRENIKTGLPDKIDPENLDFLNNRIAYISEGIKVTTKRAIATRNFYNVFFPLISLTLIDILKGPLSMKGYFASFVVAILIGGVFWYYYFRNDILDIENDIEELNDLKAAIKEIRQ